MFPHGQGPFDFVDLWLPTESLKISGVLLELSGCPIEVPSYRVVEESLGGLVQDGVVDLVLLGAD